MKWGGFLLPCFALISSCPSEQLFKVSHYWKLCSKHQGSVMYWSWLQEHKLNLIASALWTAHWEFKVLILAELDASESYCSHPLAAQFLQHRQKWTMTTASNYRLHINALAFVVQVSCSGWKVCGGLIRAPFGWSWGVGCWGKTKCQVDDTENISSSALCCRFDILFLVLCGSTPHNLSATNNSEPVSRCGVFYVLLL